MWGSVGFKIARVREPGFQGTNGVGHLFFEGVGCRFQGQRISAVQIWK